MKTATRTGAELQPTSGFSANPEGRLGRVIWGWLWARQLHRPFLGGHVSCPSPGLLCYSGRGHAITKAWLVSKLSSQSKAPVPMMPRESQVP